MAISEHTRHRSRRSTDTRKRNSIIRVYLDILDEIVIS
jgi:hypothetical protein